MFPKTMEIYLKHKIEIGVTNQAAIETLETIP